MNKFNLKWLYRYESWWLNDKLQILFFQRFIEFLITDFAEKSSDIITNSWFLWNRSLFSGQNSGRNLEVCANISDSEIKFKS